MTSKQAKQTMTHLEETLAKLFRTTKAQTKNGKTQLVPPLKKFSNKGRMKIAFTKPNSRSTEKAKSSAKKSCSGSVSSGKSLSGFPHTISLQRWGDCSSSKESLELMMVTEATSGSDDRIQQMTLAIEKLTKSLQEKDAQVAAIMHKLDVFAWSYKEMSGLDPRIAVHHLAVKHGVQPIKQPQRRFRPEVIPQIEVEVNKLIEAGFIREVKYLTWISNIVHVKKKNGQLRVSVDFRDLNQACPKYDFSLSIIELMVDATTRYEVLSFMDGFFG